MLEAQVFLFCFVYKGRILPRRQTGGGVPDVVVTLEREAGACFAKSIVGGTRNLLVCVCVCVCVCV